MQWQFPTLRRTLVSAAYALTTLFAVAVALMVATALLHRFHVLDSGPEATYRSSLWCVLLAVAAGLGVFCRRSDTRERSVLFGAWRPGGRWYVAAIVAALGVTALVQWLHKPGAATSDDNPVQLFFAQAGHSVPAWILAVAYLAVAVPVLEEILFRRAIYGVLARWSPWIAFAVSVAVFTAVHPAEIRGPVLLVGVATAWLYQRSGSLLPGIACHGLGNLLATIAIAARTA